MLQRNKKWSGCMVTASPKRVAAGRPKDLYEIGEIPPLGQRIWGYETPDGSFAQFCRVQSRQLMEKPRHLAWEEAACYTLTLATAYRMLFGHPPHMLKPGDNVLVWGGSGGLGVFGVQLAAASGANAIGVISDPSKRDYVLELGAKGVVNRKEFTCWGAMPKVGSPEYDAWVKEARKFGK